jgi:hypothetical protein
MNRTPSKKPPENLLYVRWKGDTLKAEDRNNACELLKYYTFPKFFSENNKPVL